MNSEKFAWTRVSDESAAIELKKKNVLRKLTKDSKLACRLCKKRPKTEEWAYYPAKNTSTTNKTIAHQTCVDEFYAEHTAKVSASSNRIVINKKELSKSSSSNNGGHPQPSKNRLTAEMQQLWQQMLDDQYQEGFNAGVKAAAARLQSLSDIQPESNIARYSPAPKRG